MYTYVHVILFFNLYVWRPVRIVVRVFLCHALGPGFECHEGYSSPMFVPHVKTKPLGEPRCVWQKKVVYIFIYVYYYIVLCFIFYVSIFIGSKGYIILFKTKTDPNKFVWVCIKTNESVYGFSFMANFSGTYLGRKVGYWCNFD